MNLSSDFFFFQKCTKPVIVAVHGACLGAGIDMISACDIRYCTQDSRFQIKVTGNFIRKDAQCQLLEYGMLYVSYDHTYFMFV